MSSVRWERVSISGLRFEPMLERRWRIDGVVYRLNQFGGYAQYRKGETWRESAKISNQYLLENLQYEL